MPVNMEVTNPALTASAIMMILPERTVFLRGRTLYPILSAQDRMASLVSSFIRPFPVKALETVASDRFISRAISEILTIINLI